MYPQKIDEGVEQALLGYTEQLQRLQLEVEDLLWRETVVAGIAAGLSPEEAIARADAVVAGYGKRSLRAPERESGVRMRTVGDAQ